MTLAGSQHAVAALVIWASLLAAIAAQTTSSPAPLPQSTANSPSLLSFVRSISGAQDVKPAHPVAERTLDIIAGPKEDSAATDVLEAPIAVTTDAAHRLYVADPGVHGVHVFDFDQSKYFLLDSHSDKLLEPAGLAVSQEGSLYVSDARLGSISIYDAKGKFHGYLGKHQRESYFETPVGIAIDTVTGRLYVCDAGRDMVIALDRKGHVVAHFGKRGGGAETGEFRKPTQVATNGSALIVLDTGNQRLQILDMKGHFRSQIKLAEVDKNDGLAVDREGNIYVAQSFLNRILVFDRNGQSLYRLGKNGARAGEFEAPSGLWVDPRDGLYVADAGNHRVQQFRINRPGEK
jgi:DNA-binding beta-propeller fold protein YncE